MGAYPGNTSLSTAVKERVVSTFQQTLALFKQGRIEEVVQGCGLILRMDPMFDPAKKLMEKARNPSAPIDADSLLGPDDPMAEARAAMAARNFQRVIDITTEVLTNDLMNDEARLMNEQAREKLEAAPFIDQFIKKTEQQIAKGDVAGARAGLDKIRSLDGDDTAIRRLEGEISKIKPAAASSASFVVDTPAAPGRGSAQASDFGFTFEEEKATPASFSFDSPFSTDTGTVPPVTPPGNFSFDAPKQPTPPPQPPPSSFSFDTPPPSPTPFPGAPAPGGFDFATASIETTPDDQKKVQEYLEDGDRAFNAGQYQQAIDLWSRVFLIDVTNELASERIEKAKGKRQDAEQRGESLLAAGVQAFDRGDRAGAKENFTKLLQIDPLNSTAQDYLERMSDTGAGGAASFDSSFTPPAQAQKKDIFADDYSSLDSLSPPAAGSAAAPSTSARKPAAAKTAAATSASQGRQLPMRAIIMVVVVVLVAGGWFAWSKFMAKPPYDATATAAIFRNVAVLSQKGQYDAAIALLQEIKPDDPQHDKALGMMADLQNKKSTASELVNGRPAEAVFQENLVAGRTAFDSHDYDAAKKAFDSAARIKPLPPVMKALYDAASQQVSKLEGAKSLFSERRFQEALTNLQGLAQQDPQNQSIKRLITDAHFNLGAVALQEERLPDAVREFDEVLKVDPNDELAKRSKALAERYNGQAKDLLYKIYVKYLPMRKVT